MTNAFSKYKAHTVIFKCIFFVFLFCIFQNKSSFATQNGVLDPWSASENDPVIEEHYKPAKKDPYKFKTSPFISLFWMIESYKLTSSSTVSCTFYPTCSEYTKQAVMKHGLLGFTMGAERLMRFHRAHSGYELIDTRIGLRLYDPLENNDFWF